MRLVEDLSVLEVLKDSVDDSRVYLLLGGHDYDLLRRYEGELTYDDPTVIDASVPNSEVIIGNTGMICDANGAVRIVSRSVTGNATLHNISVTQVVDMNKLAHDTEALSSSLTTVNHSLKHVNEQKSRPPSHALLLSPTPLEGTGSIVRSRETNLGNLLADMIRIYYAVDIALVNMLIAISCSSIVIFR
ncbi:hypothetical protein J3E71DRAFT_341392 [Bipolaris maydis]|nr:hypothetical protein J3E71DRAFT_341392 [Bipolaris maydis]